MDGDGDFLWTTYEFPVGNYGAVYVLTPSDATQWPNRQGHVLASFTGGSDGAAPAGGLTIGTDGNFYGETERGGSNPDPGGYGTIFQLAGNTINTLATFSGGSDGGNPNGGLITDNAGNLYGMTGDSAGTVFEVARGSHTITTLTSFNGSNGAGPDGLIMDDAGNLYGTTGQGGDTYGEPDPNNPGGVLSGYGTIFKLTRLPYNAGETVNQASPTISVTPGGAVVLGSGKLLTASATLSGGDNETGTITFRLYDSNGDLVDNESANVNGDGTYSAPIGYTPTVPGTYLWVAAYNGDDNNAAIQTDRTGAPETVSAASPSLIQSAGSTILFGSGDTLTDSASLSGGFNPTGTITFTLYAPDGITVVDTETVEVDGNGVYTAPAGYLPTEPGTYQWAAGYDGDPANNPALASSFSVSTLVSFNLGTDGGNPYYAGVTGDTAGNLYGTTNAGGNGGGGTVFELDAAGNLAPLYSFSTSMLHSINAPLSGLVRDDAGNLYGTAGNGGTNGGGVIFKFALRKRELHVQPTCLTRWRSHQHRFVLR